MCRAIIHNGVEVLMNYTCTCLIRVIFCFFIAAGCVILPQVSQATMESPGQLSKHHSDFETDCSSCHKPDSQLIDPSSCLNCHDGISKQIEAGKGIHTSGSRDCAMCHKDHKGRESSLKINPATIHTRDFQLSGKHLTVPCQECHINGTFKGNPKECQVCHWTRQQDDLYQTRLGIECGKCHTPLGWVPANWNHTIETGFTLSGNHKARACDECHPNLNFTGVDPACYSCHASNYNSTQDPNHRASGFPLDCSICHDTTSFSHGRFDHATSGFALTGAHLLAQCSDCHPDGRFQGTSPECYSCHKTDYESTRDPDHKAGGFPTDCSQCHTTSGFRPSKFDHNSTGFTLTGAHLQADCSQCHPGGRFEGTPSDCYSCHKPNYDGTTNPSHKNAGFPTDCTQCHSTDSFSHTSFNHDTTGFHLEGAHKTADCSQCHVNNQYAGTSHVCYSCHKSNYEGASDPNHKSAGFPTDCTYCHKFSDFSFNQARFDHPYFPITSGVHSHFDCNECHTNPSNFAQFDCTNCHSKSRTDNDHEGIPGYRYDPKFCYSCHPDGRP
jgi:hypothetical protein